MSVPAPLRAIGNLRLTPNGVYADYLLSGQPFIFLSEEWQDRVAEEARAVQDWDFGAVSRLKVARDVFREALRLYPPVPMMVREASGCEHFRDREVPKGAQLVLSPWHLHRHARLWDDPDGFDPGRWQGENGRRCGREAYIPFSAGARVCTGAGFAMIEGVLILARLMARYHVAPVEGRVPVPVAHLTVRSKDGIWLKVSARG